MITTETIEDLVKQGRLAGDTKMSIGRSELGIGIKSGVPKPDIKTVEGLKKALREVKSITYPQDGASRGTIEKSNGFPSLTATSDRTPVRQTIFFQTRTGFRQPLRLSRSVQEDQASISV
jgi:hypothetical protein